MKYRKRFENIEFYYTPSLFIYTYTSTCLYNLTALINKKRKYKLTIILILENKFI